MKENGLQSGGLRAGYVFSAVVDEEDALGRFAEDVNGFSIDGELGFAQAQVAGTEGNFESIAQAGRPLLIMVKLEKAETAPPLNYQKRGHTIDLAFWRAPERLFDEPDELVAWARIALAAARRVAAKRSRSSRGRKSKP